MEQNRQVPSLFGAEFVGTKTGRCRVCWDQNRPVPSLFGADILGAKWLPSLRGAEFAKCRVCWCRVCKLPKCPVPMVPKKQSVPLHYPLRISSH